MNEKQVANACGRGVYEQSSNDMPMSLGNHLQCCSGVEQSSAQASAVIITFPASGEED